MKTYSNLFLSLILLALTSQSSLFANPDEQSSLLAQLYEATDRRDADQQLFQRALAMNDLAIQKAALIGLGRIGDPDTVTLIGSSLYSPQPEIRKHAAYALAISGAEPAYQWLVKRLDSESNTEVKAELLAGIGLLPKAAEDKDKIAIILPFLDDESLAVRAAACDALNYAWSMYRDSISVPNSTQVFKLLSMAQGSAMLADHCLYALTRIRTETALFDKAHLQKTIQAVTAPNHHKLLLALVAEQQDASFGDYVIRSLTHSTDPGVRSQAATAAARLAQSETQNKAYLAVVKDSSSQVKIGFIQGLATIAPTDQSIAWLKHLSEDSSEWVTYRAMSLLFQAQSENYRDRWLAVFDSKSPAQATWESMILQVVAEMDTDAAKAIIRRALSSNHETIRDYAESLQDEQASDGSRPDSKTAKYVAAQAVFGRSLTLKTSRGDITLQLLSAAPYSALNFYQLAMDGYYDGVLFHRVIPNFVAQGGDPTGTGSGGPGYSIREELSFARHERGSVGMATAGKDTGGSQFFFNLKPNWHLDRRYTIFARVTSGLDVMDALERGDYIISIKEN